MLLTSDTLVQCFFFFCFFLLQYAPLYNTCQQKQQPNPHHHPQPHRTKFGSNKCVYLQSAYMVIGRWRGSADPQLLIYHRLRTHVRITHSDHPTTKHTFAPPPHPPFRLQKYIGVLAVVSRQARLHCENGSHYLSGCVSRCLR